MKIKQFEQYTSKEIFNLPKLFVEEALADLRFVHDKAEYDYMRYIDEELGELLGNYVSGASISNRTLLVDDIADSLWVVLAKISEKELKIAIDYADLRRNDIGATFEDAIACVFKEFIQGKDLSFILYGLLRAAYSQMIDVYKLVHALAEENFSKFNFDRDKINEVYRDGKLNKKSPDGVCYSWFRATDFSKF